MLLEPSAVVAELPDTFDILCRRNDASYAYWLVPGLDEIWLLDLDWVVDLDLFWRIHILNIIGNRRLSYDCPQLMFVD